MGFNISESKATMVDNSKILETVKSTIFKRFKGSNFF